MINAYIENKQVALASLREIGAGTVPSSIDLRPSSRES